LTATATSSTSVGLKWTASTDSGINATGVVKYNILRKGPADANYIVIAQTTTTSYNDSGRIANTAYSYIVQAADGAGNVSNNSNTASATTLSAADTAAPSIPTNLAGYLGWRSRQIDLSWNASTDSGGSGLAGYNVYRNGVKINSSLVTGTSYGDATVVSGNTYSYSIEAVDKAGNKSAKSSSVSIYVKRKGHR
jgi:fibronectin type 3 domain-containing protein